MFNLFGKSIFALDISDFSIEALQINRARKVKKFGRILLEKGIIEDGFVLKKEKLAQEIKRVLDVSKIKAREVILSLPDSKTFVCLFRIPGGLQENQIESAVKSEAEKTIPLEIEKLYWDYKIITQTNEGYSVLFVGTLKEIIEDYIEVLRKLGIEVAVFEPECLAIGRALLEDKKLDTNVVIADIGARTTNISIFDKDANLCDSVTLELGGENFTCLIAKAMNISKKEAEKTKRKVGFDEKKNPKIALVLKQAVSPIMEEIKKLIEYHRQRIQKIFLAGGSSQLPKIAQHFSSILNIKVEVGTSVLVKQLKKRSVLFNTVAGLALRTIKKDPYQEEINLLPHPKKKKALFYAKQGKPREINIHRFLEITAIFIFAMTVWTFYIFLIRSPFLSLPSQETSSREAHSPRKTPSEQPATDSFEIIPKEETTTQQTNSQVITSQEKKEMVIIQQTETGWLNVRMGPGTDYPIIKKIYPGESYPLLAEFDKWYKIKLEEKTGWIASRYARKVILNNQ